MSLAVVVTQPIPTANAVKTCACGATFESGCGFVEGLDAVSFTARGKQFDSHYPLAISEILEAEKCQACARCGSEVISTTSFINKMRELVKKNARELAKQQESQAVWGERERAMRLEMASKRPDNRGFVNQTFAEAKPRKEHHKKPGQRYRNSSKPKREEVVEGKPSKKNKGGDKNKSKGGKGKGKGR